MQIANLLKEEAVSVGDIEPFLPGYNNVHAERNNNNSMGSRNVSTVALENMTTILQTVILSNPLSFVKNLVDLPSFQRFVESYLCHRSKPYERNEDHLRQSHHLLLLSKLDKLIVAFFKRLCEVFSKELVVMKKFAAARKISVFKASEKSGPADSEELSVLQVEFRSIINEKVRILRLPYILELMALMGESNIALSSALLIDLFCIRPAMKSEIGAVIQESFQTVRDIYSGLVELKASGIANKTSLSIEGSLFFSADIAHSLSIFLLALSVEYAYEAGIFHVSAQLSADIGNALVHIAQILWEQILPILTEAISPSLTGKSSNVDNEENLQKALQIIKLSAMRMYQRILEISLLPVPEKTVQIFSGHSFSAAATASEADVASISWFDIFSQSLPNENSLILRYLSNINGALQQYESLLLPTFGEVSTVHMYLKSLGDAAGLSLPLPAEEESKKMKSNISTTANSKGSISPALQEKIQHLKDMFPDFGAAFLEACLRFYNEQENEVLDALLTDNLHPRLATLNRSMETFPTAASGNPSSTSVGTKPKKLAANETVDIFAQRQNPEYVAQQIAFVRQREALQAADATLVRREYDDDYDDQYDDLISKKDTAADNEYAESIYEDPRLSQSGRKREEWHRQMAEMRRFNTLLRAEEQDIAFWKSMAINNHAAPTSKSTSDTTTHGNAEAELPSSEKNPNQQQPPLQKQQQPHRHPVASHSETQQHGKGQSEKNSRREKSSDEAPAESESHHNKFRTKTFDRHHQKDKSLRKLGAFRPT